MHKIISLPLLVLAVSAGISFLGGMAGCSDQRSANEFLTDAKNAYGRNAPEVAVASLKEALLQEPDNGEARLLLAQIYVDGGNGKAGLHELEKAEAAGMSMVQIGVPRLHALMLEHKFEDALDLADQLKDILKSNDQLAETAAVRGAALLSLGRVSEAKEAYVTALRAVPNNGLALTGLVQLALKANERDEALEKALKATELASNYAPAWSILGDVRYAMGDTEEAESAYSEAIAKRWTSTSDRLSRALARIELNKLDDAREDIAVLRRNGFVNPHALFAEGVLLYRTEKFKEASEKFEEVLGKHPNYIKAACYSGISLSQVGRSNLAKNRLETCLTNFPQAASARRALAALLAVNGDGAGTEAVLAPLINKNPPDTPSLELLARIKLAMNEPQEAAKLLQDIVRSDAKNTSALLSLGVALAASNQLEEASQAFANAAAFDNEIKDPALLEAVALLQTQHFREAAEKLQLSLNASPQNVTAHNLLGIALASSGELDEAEQSFRRTLEIDADNTHARINLANVLVRKGDIAQAAKLLDEALHLKPDSSQAMGMALSLDLRTGNVDKARERLKRVDLESTENDDLLMLKARFEQQQGNNRAAIKIYRRLLSRHETSAELLRELGTALLSAGEHKDAEGVLTRLVVSPHRVPADFLLLANAHEMQSDLHKAREAIENALVMAPKFPGALLAQIKLDIAERKLDQARKRLDTLRELAPTDPGSNFLATEGKLLLLEGRPNEAIKAFSRATEAEPRSSRVIQLARAYAETGNPDGAIDILEKWYEAHPADRDVRFILANAYSQNGRELDAIQAYDKLVSEYPDDVLSLNNLAWLLRTREPERSMSLAKRAAEKAPSSPAILDTLASLQREQGQLDLAVSNLRKAYELAPTNAELSMNFASLLLAVGSSEEAIRVLNKVNAERLTEGQRETYDLLRRDLGL